MMLQHKDLSESVDHSWNWLYKLGGISFLIIGIWYVVANYWASIAGIPAPGFATPPVATNAQYFNILASYPVASTVFYSMYSLIDLFFVPALVALYIALKGVHKNAMLVAMGLVALFVVIDLAVTEFNSLTLISLTQSYQTATDATQRAAYLAASDYALGAIPIATFYSYVVGSLGFLIASIVMFRGVFRKTIAVIGIVSTLLGIVSGFVLFAPGLAILIFPTLNLYGLWNILVGAQLLGLGGKQLLKSKNA
jgi:hypothetical protein